MKTLAFGLFALVGAAMVGCDSSPSSSYPSSSGSVLTGNYSDSWHDTAEDDAGARRRGFANAEQERGVYLETGKRMLAQGYSQEEVETAMLIHMLSQ